MYRAFWQIPQVFILLENVSIFQKVPRETGAEGLRVTEGNMILIEFEYWEGVRPFLYMITSNMLRPKITLFQPKVLAKILGDIID